MNWEHLEEIEQRYEELTRALADPQVIADQARLQQMAKKHAELAEIVETFRAYKRTRAELADARQMLADKLEPELRELVHQEIEALREREARLQRELRRLLLPRDPNDEKNVILEIRAGTGGEEAALFAADLLRMYTRYAERQGWRTELMSASPTELGGFKEVVVMVHGRGAYSRLKFERGVHRVQRIPVTEAGGRIHTSTATVAVLPEVEEVEVHIDPDDLEIDVFRASGHGGQHVNTTDSAVRITHKPTGIVVTCQDERSQFKNREKAMKILRARLFAKLQAERQAELADMRRSQVGTGERSERIRTYNFPQGRVTDHRIGLTLYRLQEILDGDLDELIEALAAADQEARLKELPIGAAAPGNG